MVNLEAAIHELPWHENWGQLVASRGTKMTEARTIRKRIKTENSNYSRKAGEDNFGRFEIASVLFFEKRGDWKLKHCRKLLSQQTNSCNRFFILY